MLTKLLKPLQRFLREEDGATMVEYGFVLALIALVCVSVVVAVGQGANGLFTSNGDAISTSL